MIQYQVAHWELWSYASSCKFGCCINSQKITPFLYNRSLNSHVFYELYWIMRCVMMRPYVCCVSVSLDSVTYDLCQVSTLTRPQMMTDFSMDWSDQGHVRPTLGLLQLSHSCLWLVMNFLVPMKSLVMGHDNYWWILFCTVMFIKMQQFDLH